MHGIEVWVEASLRTAVELELSEGGYRLHTFDPAAPPRQGVLLIAGAERAEQLARELIKVAVVAVVSPSELSYPSRAIADLVLNERARGELSARVQRLMAQDAPGFRVHLLTRAVEFAGDIIELGTTGAVLQYVNPAYEKVLGISAQDAEGKTPGQLVRSDYHPPEFFQRLDATLKAGKVWSGRLVSRGAHGNQVHLDATIAPVIDRNGQHTHHVAVKRDVTERVAREREMEAANRALVKARDAALAANKTKSEFLANMSHELRTPLNAVIGYSELLMEDAEEAQNDSLLADLQKIRNAGKHLLGLINDVLDMSKIEAGKMSLDLQTVELKALVGELLETLAPLAKASGNAIRVELTGAPDQLRCDPQKLRQVLTNLLSNACKFMQDGEVVLEASTAPDGALRISVRDTGIGMTGEEAERIFLPFVQADASTTRRYGGTGLGLAISRRFCEMMGGSIEVVSEPGRGSTFTVILPSDMPGGQGALRAAPAVLVIDGDQLTYRLLNHPLEARGYHVEWASSGDHGLIAAVRRRPDVVVLDVSLPDMDGWGVLTRLKEDAETAEIPVVLVTSAEQRELGLSLGASDYVVKPIHPQRLLGAVQRWLGQHGEGRVLVVDDDEAMRDIMQRTLTLAGYRVATADGGSSALSLLEDGPCDLVVLDLMMPEMDGFEFLERLRRTEAGRHVPVIVATAKTLSAEEQRALGQSVDRVIQKSAQSRAELLGLVEAQVGRLARRNGRASEPSRRGGAETDRQSPSLT